MNTGATWGRALLLVGDLGIFLGSLWVALVLRFGSVPDAFDFGGYTAHFLPLFLAWAVVFYIAGLYDRFAFDFRRRIFSVLVRAQVASALLAVLYFYVADTAIAPKTILLIYLGVVFLVVLAWRLLAFPLVYRPSRVRAVVVCAGEEPLRELVRALEGREYGVRIVGTHDTAISDLDAQSLRSEIEREDAGLVVFDYRHVRAREVMETLYPLIFRGVRFVPFESLYETVFSRVSIAHLSPEWFSQNTYARNRTGYAVAKRLMDLLIALPLLAVTAPLFPFVALAIRAESRGNILFLHERIGRNGRVIRIPKFRSMTVEDRGVWLRGGDDPRITRVGSFLRKTRIDELPQLWSVLRGDLSLVGPRPDIVALGRELEETVPYYAIRNIVAPGLSGWAQIIQEKPPQSVEETVVRLSYDLYYIKHRSLTLDLEIALKTVRTLLSRVGM